MAFLGNPLGLVRGCRGVRGWFLAFAAIVLVLGTLRLRAVASLLPYDQHVDEAFITQRALNILRTGDWNPHFFRYPSLPIYLAAGAMKLGGELQAPEQSVSKWKVPKHGGIYRPPWMYGAPRMLFALSSVITLAFIGLIARKLYRSNLALLLAPLILASSAVFQTSSVRYLNVDVITLFFVSAALWVTFQWWERDSFLLQSVVPGVLAGMAVASKYNSGLVLVPLVLRVLFVNGQQRAAKLAVLGGCAAGAFFLCVPYSVLDASTFWADVVWEINHYQNGHRHFDGEPGLPQLLFYLRKLTGDFGGPLLTLSGLGILGGLLISRASTLSLLSLPLLMLLHMCANRVHFLRTVLPVFALLPVFAAGGLVVLERLLLPVYWQRYADPVGRVLPAQVSRFMTHKLWPRATALGVVLLYWVLADSAFLRDTAIPPETRNSVAGWLWENANGAHVIVPPEAGLNKSATKGMHWVKAKSGLSDLKSQVKQVHSSECYVVVPRYSAGKRTKALSKALASWNSRVVFKVEGETLRMPKNKAQSVRMKPNPALALHFIETCGAATARAILR